MRLYTDAFTGTEILSDSYKAVLEYEGTVAKVKSRLILKTQDNVDIGCGNAFGGQAEEEQTGGNQTLPKVVDLIDAFNYEQTSFDKAGFGKYFKKYMKKVLGLLTEKKSERIDSFKKGAQEFFAWVNQHFEDITFYTPSDYDTENAIIMSYFEEGAETPTFLYIMDGLKQTKV